MKALQNALGVTADGLYGSQSKSAAGGLSAEEAYKKFVGGTPAKVQSNPHPASAHHDVQQSLAFPTTYSEAVAYLRAHNVDSAYASGIRDQAAWQRKKNSGNTDAEVANYKTYQDYLTDVVEFMLDQYGSR